MNKLLFSLAIVFCFSLKINAQDVSFTAANFPNNKKELSQALKSIKEGDAFSAQKKYVRAIDAYMSAYKLNPNNALLNFKIAFAYADDEFFNQKACAYAEKAIQLNPNINNTVYYILGCCKQINQKFDEAETYYKRYKQNYNAANDPYNLDLVNKKITECSNGKNVKHNDDIVIEVLSDRVNSPYNDFGAIFYNNETAIMFTSDRPIGSNDNFDKIEHLFSAAIKENTVLADNSWEDAKSMGATFNLKKKHSSIKGISRDEQYAIFYHGQDNGTLYEAEFKKGKWKKPKKLPKQINTPYAEKFGIYGMNSNTLYFTSDRPGGYGGLDFYKVTRNDKGKWGTPENLGSAINSPYDEISLFLSNDSTFYLSSKGHSSIGESDIFKTILKNGKFSEPENFGTPINSAADDAFFILSKDRKHAYFASIRDAGTGTLDIYRITFKKGEPPVDTLDQVAVVEPEPVAPVEEEPVVETPAKPVVQPKEDDGFGKLKEGDTFILKGILFDFDKSTLRDVSVEELNRVLVLLKNRPTLELEISGHTDSYGNDDYNMGLSKRRALVVYNWLVDRGVDPKRLTYSYFGERQPIDTNATPAGRQNNRRTEFKVTRL